jgi:hypothetical protein
VSSSSIVDSGRSTSRFEVHIYKFSSLLPPAWCINILFVKISPMDINHLKVLVGINSAPGMFCLNVQRLVAPVLYIG